MPRTRAPQNSASSCEQRLFSDLQAVYQKIIQTNGASFPFRAKDSRRSLHTAPAGTRSRQPLTVSNSVFTSRTPSACGSVEEIIIKPLQFHERLAFTACPSRTASSVELNGRPRSELDTSCEVILGNESKYMRPRYSADSPVEYSGQSIRYVTEQVSLEQARQLKLRSNIKQHRVDRRYFVSGSKMHIQKQAFEDTHDNIIELSSDKQGIAKTRRCSHFRPPAVKRSTQRNLEVSETDVVRGLSIDFNNHIEEASTVAIPTDFVANTTAPPHVSDIDVQSHLSTESPATNGLSAPESSTHNTSE